jgi:uncharacterized membrane protein
MHTLEAAILVNAPVSECYRRWMAFERFPEFMSRVVRVRRIVPESMTSEDIAHAGPNPQKTYEETMAREMVEEVKAHGGDVWHWEIRGPLGRIYSWNAGIVLNIPDKIISWASPQDPELPTSGSVNFLKQASDAQTLIEIKMSYSAPSPPFGELVADVMRYGDNLLYEALEDFKSYVEREVHGVLNPADRKAAASPVMTNETELTEQMGATR